jgi:hypothetical protein
MEIKTGVTMQCTTQRAEAHIPRLSAENAEIRDGAFIDSRRTLLIEIDSTQGPNAKHAIEILLSFYRPEPLCRELSLQTELAHESADSLTC